MVSPRPSFITEHYSMSSQSDLAREDSRCSRYLRPARGVDTTCTVGRNVHESMATEVRAHRGPNFLCGMLRSIRPTRATIWSFYGLMESMEGRPSAARALDGTRGDCRPGAEDGPAVLHPLSLPRQPRSGGRGVDASRSWAAILFRGCPLTWSRVVP
jgi:hypothetical protein